MSGSCNHRPRLAADFTRAVAGWRHIAAALGISRLAVLSYIAGISVSVFIRPGAAAAAAAAAAAFLLLGFLSLSLLGPTLHIRAGLRLLMLATALALIGLMAGSLRLGSLADSVLAGRLGQWVEVEVQVKRAANFSSNGVSFIGHATGARRRGGYFPVDEDVLVRISCRDECGAAWLDELAEGSRLRLEGTVAELESKPGADFDYGLYLRRRGINVCLKVASQRVEALEGRRGGFAGLVDRLRQHARSSLAAGGWGDASGLFQGMVIGDTSQVDDGVIDDFRSSGLLHMLAVSGQNVVLLGFVIAAFCRGLRLSRRPAVLAAAAVIIIYVPLTGADASIMRAGSVGLLGLSADLLARQADRYHFMALAAALILTLNPNSLFDPGFQLSFAAVLSIFLVAPLFDRPLSNLPGALKEPIAISAAAGIVTAPITLFHFNQVPLVSVPANVAAAPVAGPVMLLGVLAVVVEPLSSLLNWCITAAACLCTGYLIVVSRLFASVPGAVYVSESPGLMAVSGFYAMISVIVVINRKPEFAGRIRLLLRSRPLVIALALLLALLLYTGLSGRTADPPSAFTVSFLDVGQGDATLLQDPQGATVLIDGGPGSDILSLLRESGVERLDAVILTHPHADHMAGLDEVFSKYEVAAFYDAQQPGGGDGYSSLLELLERRGVAHQGLRSGQQLLFGGLTLSVYHPGDWMRPDDTNANSVVLVASYGGLDILLPGDAEGEVLMTLDLPEVEVYKAPHHGSRDPHISEVLESVDPECAVISVGEGNDYGHPSEDTLSELRESGAEVYRTDRQGTVRISPSGGCEGAMTER